MEDLTRRTVLAGTGTLPAAAGAAGRGRFQLATTVDSEMIVLHSAEGVAYSVSLGFPLPPEPDLKLEIKGTKPVPIYVTDAWTTFGLLTSLTRYMRWGGELPPCVVVALGYPNERKAFSEDARAYDLTPTTHPGKFSYLGARYGGAAAYRRFILEVVQPLVRSRGDYDHDNAVLVGHSLGGLFVLDTLVNAPGAFRHHLAISPSLWFDDQIVMRQFAAELARGARFPGRLAIYAGEREERISEPEARMASDVFDCQRLIADHRSQFDAPLAEILPGLSHHSILGPALTYGLQFILSPPERRAEAY